MSAFDTILGELSDSLDRITSSIDTVLYSDDFELPKLALGAIDPVLYGTALR